LRLSVMPPSAALIVRVLIPSAAASFLNPASHVEKRTVLRQLFLAGGCLARRTDLGAIAAAAVVVGEGDVAAGAGAAAAGVSWVGGETVGAACVSGAGSISVGGGVAGVRRRGLRTGGFDWNAGDTPKVPAMAGLGAAVPAIRIATSAALTFKTCIAILSAFFRIWRGSVMPADVAASRRAAWIHSSSVADQDSRSKDNQATHDNLKCSPQKLCIHVAGPNPGNDPQLDQHDYDGEYRGDPEIID